MKVGVGYTLKKENIENIKEVAKRDERSASQWLDMMLTKYFKEHPL